MFLKKPPIAMQARKNPIYLLNVKVLIKKNVHQWRFKLLRRLKACRNLFQNLRLYLIIINCKPKKLLIQMTSFNPTLKRY